LDGKIGAVLQFNEVAIKGERRPSLILNLFCGSLFGLKLYVAVCGGEVKCDIGLAVKIGTTGSARDGIFGELK
jgi:hypothetical protein